MSCTLPTRCAHRGTRAVLTALALLCAPHALSAQQAPALGLEDVARLLASGQPRPLVLSEVRAACRAFEVDAAAEAKLTEAGADAEFIQALRATCYRPPAPPPAAVEKAADAAAVYDPGSAMIRGLVVPGLGQFYTRRPVLGAAFLGAGGAALALGVLSKKVTVECLSPPTGDVCPDAHVRSEVTKRPYLVPGLAGFVAVALVGAFEARSAARRLNGRTGAQHGEEPAGIRLGEPRLEYAGDGVAVALLRIRF